MKIILALLLLVSGTVFSQTGPVGTNYDCTTLRPIEAVWTVPTELPPNTCFTTAVVTQNWAKPTYSSGCNCFFNAATPAEQEAYEAAQQAISTPEDAMYAVNTALVSEQTNSTLNALYPYVQSNFRLTCTNVGTGMIYIKVSSTQWKGTALFSLPNN